MAVPYWKEEKMIGQEDSEIAALRAKIETGNTPKYAVQDGMLYYLWGKGKTLWLRLYVPIKLIAEIIEQCQEKLCDMVINKTCDPIVGLGLITRPPTTCKALWFVNLIVEGMKWLYNFPFEKVIMNVSGQ